MDNTESDATRNRRLYREEHRDEINAYARAWRASKKPNYKRRLESMGFVRLSDEQVALARKLFGSVELTEAVRLIFMEVARNRPKLS